MNREDNSRIRLKVITKEGINILCTALKDQKIAEWLPHFEQAYREVKEEQGDDHVSKKRMIKSMRVKKDNYYIANSEIIGDVFEDNDEVFCEIVFPQSKKQSKEAKQKKKAEEQERVQSSQKNKEKSKPKQKEACQEGEKEDKEHQQSKKKVKRDQEKKQTAPQKETQQPETPDKKKKKQKQSKTPSSVLQKVDLSKLKSLIVKEEAESPKPQKKSHESAKKSSQ